MHAPFDPWRWAAAHGTPIRQTRLEYARGYTDGHTIWIDPSHTAAEARCTLTHELVHLCNGHRTHQPPREEWRVRATTARIIIPDMRPLLGWSGDLWELADELNVTPELIRDRVCVWERTGT